jgi:hypothetical protein
MNVKLLASCILESAEYWYQAKKVGVGSTCSIKFCVRLAVRQVVFTDVVVCTVRAFLLLAYTKQTLPLIGRS